MARTKDPELEAERRRLVADATIALLTESSWRGATLSAVAARAGVSKGVVTYWFSSKDALILAAIERFHARYEETLMAIALTDAPAQERLAALIEAAFPSQQEVADEVAFQAEVWSFAKSHPGALEAIRGSYARFQVACEALLQLGVEEGYVTREDTDGLYRYIHALLDGTSLQVAYAPDIAMEEVRASLVQLLGEWLRGGAQ